MPTSLNREDRLKLMKFICSFAWADLEVRDEERKFIAKMVAQLGLDEDEMSQVQQWLIVPPSAEELDPGQIPPEHKQLFLDAARAVIVADGTVGQEEAETLALLDLLVR